MRDRLRTQSEIINDIKALVASPGYIVTLCMILFEDHHVFVEELDNLNIQERLSKNEGAFLTALFLQNKDITIEPNKHDDLISYKAKTYELFEELHLSYNDPFFDKLLTLLKDKENKPKLPFREEQKNFMGDAQIIKEAITYSSTGVYDVQYLDFLGRKYKNDRNWLIENKDFDFDEIRSITLKIRKLLGEKAKRVHLVGLKENVEQLIKQTKKKVKKGFNEKYFRETILPTFDFYQYRELFNTTISNNANEDELREFGWKSFYQGIIDLFTINKSELKEEQNIDAFFENFSFIPGRDSTSSVQTMEDYNILNSKPIIKFDEDRYFIPSTFLVFESIYETPFYWMCADEAYKDKLSANRGNAGEEIVFDFLSDIFVGQTYRAIKVSSKKGEPYTDIDILCILGNKALCIQVKSKKLTLLARTGNNDQLLKDFQGAVQDAYNQGLICRNKIINKSARFFDADGNELKFAEQIDEVYIMGVTTENYPSLTHQSYVLLDKEDNDPFPIFLTVFDLQLLTHYLKDPYDFLYYVRQRINLMDYFRGGEELVYLSYHLTNKLYRIPDADAVVIPNDYGLLIDRNYYCHIYGLEDKDVKKDKIRNSWINADFQEICNGLKEFTNTPQITDVIFDIFDLSQDTQQMIINGIRVKKRETAADKKNHNFSILPSDNKNNVGFTYVSHSTNISSQLEKELFGFVAARKYRHKTKKWIGLGSFAMSGANKIDLITYHDYEWLYDQEMENASNEVLGSAIEQHRRMSTISGHKIGRNERCPCGSGKKYKKCCGCF